MNYFYYFSLYIIIAGFLYFLNIINYNPFLWLIIAIISTILISTYIIINKNKYNPNFNYLSLIKYLILNTPKLLLLLIIDHKNIFKGLIFYSSLFIVYLFIINFDLYYVYYTNTTLKILNNDF
jgi:hypothetical protein